MEPIASFKGFRTFKITDGPNMHQIGACLCPASYDHFLVGVCVQVQLPYVLEDDEGEGSFLLPLILIEYKFISNENNVSFGGCLKGVESIPFLEKAPIVVPNYSTRTRKGYFQVDYEEYLKIINFLNW